LKRIDLKEWQDIGELPEFRDNPFLPIHDISPEAKKYIQITDISSKGIRIKATNYVGIIPLNERYLLTVSPKAPVEDFLYLIYRARGRKVSIKELKKVVKVGKEKIRDFPNVFHILLHVLLTELEKIRSFGFLKKARYTVRHGAVVKGKILVKETLKHWISGDKTKITCSFFELSKDVLENRAIKFTLWILLELYSATLSKEIRDDLFKKYKWFNDVSLPLEMDFVNDIEDIILHQRLPSSRSYYYDILELCLFFITHSTIEFKSAREVKIKSFVVDMNNVFELYIYNVLKESIQHPFIVKREPKITLFNDVDEYIIKPDYVIMDKKNSEVLVVADAKYKERPTTDDFQQLITYIERFNAKLGLLICPSWKESNEVKQYDFKGKKIYVYKISLNNFEKSEKDLQNFIQSCLSIKSMKTVFVCSPFQGKQENI